MSVGPYCVRVWRGRGVPRVGRLQAAGYSDYDTLLQNYADTLTQLFSLDFAAQPFTQYSENVLTSAFSL